MGSKHQTKYFWYHAQEKTIAEYKSGKSVGELCELYGVNTKSEKEHLRRWLHRQGVELRQKNRTPLHRHPSYQGGWRMMKGYIQIARTDWPRDKNGRMSYQSLHRYVMEQKLGRPLTDSEVVHHINGDVLDNTPENLELYESNAAHLAATLKGKCPKWTVSGLERIEAGILKSLHTRAQKHLCNQKKKELDGLECNETADRQLELFVKV